LTTTDDSSTNDFLVPFILATRAAAIAIYGCGVLVAASSIGADPTEETRMTKRDAIRIARECPTAWFAVLERARHAADHALEQRALCELQRLGVRVLFLQPGPNGAPAHPKGEPTQG